MYQVLQGFAKPRPSMWQRAGIVLDVILCAVCIAAIVVVVASKVAHAETKLIGGSVASPADWQASPWIGNCSSTLIGERTLLTAAHCVSNGGTKAFTIGTTRYSGTCTHHPQYSFASWYSYSSTLGDTDLPPTADEVPVGATEDWALCYLSQPVPNVKFESVADRAEFACASGAQVTLTGYGCRVWGGGIDGKFRTGLGPVRSCPSMSSQDTVTRGRSALCSGDSGGGAYTVTADGKRYVIGVNSRSNTTDTSYLSSTYTTKFRSWALAWATTKATKVCGLTPFATNCRDGAAPDPDPLPAPDCKAELFTYEVRKAEADSSFVSLKSCVEL